MNQSEAVALMVMCFGAFFMPFVSKRLVMPTAVGEIIFGVLIASMFSFNTEAMTVVGYFSSLGFLILMYMAGLEIDFERFRSLPRKDLWIYFIMFIPAGLAAFWLASAWDLHWVFALIFFTTGIGLLFPVLKDLDLVKTTLGQNLLIMGMIGEIFTLVGLTVVTMTYRYGMTSQSILRMLSIVAFFTVVYLFMRVLKVVLWWNPTLQSFFLKVGNTTETGIRTNFLILFTFTAFASAMGIELVVGAFIGGAMFALVFSGRDAVLEKLSGVGSGFFIPLFFIYAGTRVQLEDFFNIQTVILSLIISGMIFVVKIFAGMPLLLSSLKKNQIPLVTAGLSFPLTMLVAVSSVCYDVGIITKSQASAVLISSMFSAIIYPWIFKVSYYILMPDVADKRK